MEISRRDLCIGLLAGIPLPTLVAGLPALAATGKRYKFSVVVHDDPNGSFWRCSPGRPCGLIRGMPARSLRPHHPRCRATPNSLHRCWHPAAGSRHPARRTATGAAKSS